MRKKQRGRGFERPVTSMLTLAQCPRASPSPQREHSPVLFTQHDQRPSAAASDISFGVSDNELDDILSLAASDAEELLGSVTDPALLPSSASRNARLRADEELIRIMTKAVNELGLEWSPPEEPSRSRLDEWFLLGCNQAFRQRSSPFFPEVQDELTESWRGPYSSLIRPSASVALTSVDGTEEKVYEHLQWGKKVFSQPPIVQVLPLKKMREACNFHHRYTSTMRDKIRKRNPENHIVGFLKNLFANYGGK